MTMSMAEKIEALRAGAAEAGDLDAVAICDAALDGDAGSIASARAMLDDAAAMDDDAAPERSWWDH